jgi:hypothetical protein
MIMITHLSNQPSFLDFRIYHHLAHAILATAYLGAHRPHTPSRIFVVVLSSACAGHDSASHHTSHTTTTPSTLYSCSLIIPRLD